MLSNETLRFLSEIPIDITRMLASGEDTIFYCIAF